MNFRMIVAIAVFIALVTHFTGRSLSPSDFHFRSVLFIREFLIDLLPAVAAALLLRRGPRHWAPVLIMLFATYLAILGSSWTAAVESTTSAFRVFLFAWILRSVPFHREFSREADVIWLILAAIVAGPLTAYPLALALGKLGVESSILLYVRLQGFGFAVVMILTTPLFLTMSRGHVERLLKFPIKVLVFVLSFLAINLYIFVYKDQSGVGWPLIVVMMVIAVMQFGVSGCSTAALGTSIIASWFNSYENGALNPDHKLITTLWGYMGLLAIVNLVVIALRSSEVRTRADLEEAIERYKAQSIELEKAKRIADESSQAKSIFLANMSHELRTPMAAVLGYSDMLLEPDLDQIEQEEALHSIRRNGSHLLQMISDILDLSKIEAGRLELESICYSPWQILLEVSSILRHRAHEKGVDLEFRGNGRLPATATMDPTRVRQILMNLVGNAIKFSERGDSVSVQVDARPSGPNNPAILRFEVEDHGIGMTEAQLNRLFLPFQQADISTTRKFGGTGLGLSISRRLTNLMGGEISVRSQVDSGSCFTVELPLTTDESEASWLDSSALAPHVSPTVDPEEPNAPRRILSGRVLLAEDNPDNQKVIVYNLCRMGLDVQVVGDGRIAVEMALEQSFDLVLMDMQMPELDGYGATRSLRRSGFQKPIIALTAHAMLEDREKCLKAGCTDFLTKPVEVKHLANVLALHLAQRELRSSPEAPRLDEPIILSELIDDPEVAELVGEFAAGLTERAEQLRVLTESKDFDQLRSMVHQLRGSGGMYGYPVVTQAAGKIEDVIRNGQDLESLIPLVEDFNVIARRIARGAGLDSKESRAIGT